MKVSLPTALGVVATVSSVAFAGLLAVNPPTRTVVKKVEVEKPVYMLSADGKQTANVQLPKGGVNPDDIQTDHKVISNWSNKQTEHDWGDGYAVVEVDGQRCILWVRNAPGYNGEETGSGMSCRPAPLK